MDTFEQVQKLAQNKRWDGFPYNHRQEVPFPMKVICGCCGRHYTRQLWNTSAIGKSVRPGFAQERKQRSTDGVVPRIFQKQSSWKPVQKCWAFLKLMRISFLTKWNPSQCRGVHVLLFCLHDGTESHVQHWEHTAQKASWTPERKARHAANRTALAETKGASCMTGRIRCELCGMNYNKQTRKVARAGMVTFWKCRGIGNGGSCASEQITHDHLNSILAEATGVIR